MAINDIHDLIKFGIHVHGGVFLPGIGTLRIQRAPASYSQDRKTIVPPSSELVFETIEHSNLDVFNYANSLGVSTSTLETWVSTIKIQLSRPDTSFDIREIGHFKREQDLLSFVPDKEKSWNAFKHWPELHISPISNPLKSYEFAIDQPKPLTHPWKKKSPELSTWLFPLATITVVTFFLVLKTCSSPQPITKSLKAPVKKEKTVVSDHRNEAKKEAGLVLDSNSNINSTINANDTLQTAKDSSNKVTNPQKEIIKSVNSDCVFVVGAFVKYINAKNLRQELKKQGYQVEIYENKPFFRVGITFPCKVEGTIPEKIISKYPDIWLLEP